MNENYIRGKNFDKIDFVQNPLSKGFYENCTFTNCIFANADISNINFTQCDFKGCNLSLAKIARTTFNEVKFKDCKMLGLHFQHSNEFMFFVDFESCNLELCSFFKLRLKKMRFKNCSLHEADFTEADLSGSLFDTCDLTHAIFMRSVLEKTDLRSSFNYSIDPELNKLKKARFSLIGLPGLLQKYNIEIEM